MSRPKRASKGSKASSTTEVVDQNQEKSTLIFVFAALLTPLASNVPATIAEFFSCMVAPLSGECSKLALAESKLIGALITNMAISVAWVVRHFSRKSNLKESVAFFWSSVISLPFTAYFSLMKDGRFPIDLRNEVLIYSAIYILIFILPCVILWRIGGFTEQLRLFSRLIVTTVAAILFAIFVQTFAELLWKGLPGPGRGWGAPKFVIAPSGTVIIGAACAALLTEPRMHRDLWSKKPPRQASAWIIAVCIGVVAIAVGYAALAYYTPSRAWLPPPPLDQATAIAAFVGLTLPGVWLSLFLVDRDERVRPTVALGIATLAAAIVGPVAWLIAVQHFQASVLHFSTIWDMIAFSIAHSLASAAIVGSVATGVLVLPWLQRLSKSFEKSAA